jgi:hypothetical protein
MEASGEFHAPAALLPGKNSGNHWIRGWVGLRAGLDAMTWTKNRRPCRNSNPGRSARSLVTMQTELPWYSVSKFVNNFPSIRSGF